MVKGTTSAGRHSRHEVHIVCRRCGRKSFNVQKGRCAHCGFPDARWRKYSWAKRA